MLPSSADKLFGLEEQFWTVDPDTGIVGLTDEAFKHLINPDPIEKWYQIDSEPIARGQFAVVYHCRNRMTDGEFAAKFSSRWRLGVDCSTDLEHEIAICAILRHPVKAIQLVDVFTTDSDVILIMEYAPGGDLQTLLDQDLVPFERNVINFVKQILETLVHIHEKNIVHLDIKPQNLVLMGEYPDCDVKLCDFEISRVLLPGRIVRDILGTADYIAPEIIHYEPLTTKADMWSFGILIYVLLTGFLPFGGDTDQETFLEITRGKLDFPEELFEDISDQAIDFIKRLLLRQPHLRMSAKECMNHEWIKSPNTLPKISVTSVPPMASTSHSANISSSNNVNPIQNSFSFTTPGNTYSLSIPSSPSSPQNTFSNHCSSKNKCCDDKFNTRLKDSLDGLAQSMKAESSCQNLGSSHSARENGLPPVKSYMSNRTSTHSSTSSLSKGGSKQSLDRIRSISKSREILFERLQKSSQRKILSRSRERLYDSKFGIYLSREKLLENRSISQSVETLPPSELGNNDLNSFYSSSGNVCALPVFSMLPLVEESSMNCRQYKSMAAINNIDGEYDSSATEKRRKESVYSNFAYAAKGYENLLANKPEIARKDSSCILKNQNNNEPKTVNGKVLAIENQKKRAHHQKQSHQNSNTYSKSLSTTRNADKGKKDSQRRKKEKERAKGTTSKENNTISDIFHNNNNENKKAKYNNRGSGHNIEERIQIRRTRKNKANTKSESKTSNIRQSNKLPETSKKIVPSTGANKLNHNNKSVTFKNNDNAQKTKKTCSNHVSSVPGNSPFGVCVNKPLVPYSHKIDISKNIVMSHKITVDNITGESYCKVDQSRKPIMSPDRQDIDEAYASLEEPVDESICDNRHFESESLNCNKLSDSSHRIEEALQILSLTDITKPALRNNYNAKLNDNMEVDIDREEIKYDKSMECSRNYDKSKDVKLQDLTVIAEEEETVSITSYVRSVSTCSDISSIMSEFSEDLKSRRNSESQEMKNRRRSLNAHTTSGTFIPDKLSRSKSLHLDSPLSGKTRPWGELCNGSVGRAYSILSQKSSDFIFVPRKNSDPTSNRPKGNVNEKNSRISVKNRLLKV